MRMKRYSKEQLQKISFPLGDEKFSGKVTHSALNLLISLNDRDSSLPAMF